MVLSIPNTNNLQAIIWSQVFLSNTNNSKYEVNINDNPPIEDSVGIF